MMEFFQLSTEQWPDVTLTLTRAPASDQEFEAYEQAFEALYQAEEQFRFRIDLRPLGQSRFPFRYMFKQANLMRRMRPLTVQQVEKVDVFVGHNLRWMLDLLLQISKPVVPTYIYS